MDDGGSCSIEGNYCTSMKRYGLYITTDMRSFPEPGISLTGC